MSRPFVLALALAVCMPALAQTAASAPPKPSSPAKKALVAKVLALQQPGIEALARQLVEQPAALLLQQAGPALQQRVPAPKRDAVGQEIQADARKYVDETGALVRDRAVKLAPTTIGPLLEERFNEDELKQIVAILESPVNKRYQQLGGEMQRTLVEKLVAETRPLVEPKVKALEQGIVKKIDAATPAPAAPAASPAKP